MEKRNNKFIVLFMSDRMCVYHVVSFGSLESLKVKISKLVRSVFFRANLSPYNSIFEMGIYSVMGNLGRVLKPWVSGFYLKKPGTRVGFWGFFHANLSPYTSIFEMSIYIHI